MRNVIIHYHIFKNAGCSFDECLHESFGEGFTQLNHDPPTPVMHAELSGFLHEHSSVRAISSHTARWPEPRSKNLRSHPIVFLRHPIDRVGSIYTYFRHTGNPDAGTRTLAEYVEWLLGVGRGDPSSETGFSAASSFQTLFLSDEVHITQTPQAPLGEMTEAHFASAVLRLMKLPAFGLVERFDDSLALIGRTLAPDFPELTLRPRRVNASENRANSLQQRMQDVVAALGPRLYARLVRMNEADLELYALASGLFESCIQSRSSRLEHRLPQASPHSPEQ